VIRFVCKQAGEPTDETWCLNSMTMTWHLLNPAGVTPGEVYDSEMTRPAGSGLKIL